MKAYILTVRHSSDTQLGNLVAGLQSLGFEIEIVTGVLGARMEAGEYFSHAAKVFSTHGYLISPGELACTLGHMKIYESIVGGASPHAFVFEDDVILGDFSRNIELVNEILRVNSSEFIHLGGQDGIPCRFKIRGYPHAMTDRLVSVPAMYLPFLNRTCGYVISKDHASRLLGALRKCPFKIDDFVAVALAFSVSSLDFFDAVSHPIDTQASLIERERLLIPGAPPSDVRLFQRILSEVRRSIGFRFAVIMRWHAEWRKPTVALYSRNHE